MRWRPRSTRIHLSRFSRARPLPTKSPPVSRPPSPSPPGARTRRRYRPALIARPQFRPYWSTDLVGAEIGGAVKNVLAIACGVVEGAGLGQNARASLISRGLAEMTRFGLALGARPETLAGLSGLGDLVLTCSSTSSAQLLARPRPGAGPRRARSAEPIAAPWRRAPSQRPSCARPQPGTKSTCR